MESKTSKTSVDATKNAVSCQSQLDQPLLCHDQVCFENQLHHPDQLCSDATLVSDKDGDIVDTFVKLNPGNEIDDFMNDINANPQESETDVDSAFVDDLIAMPHSNQRATEDEISSNSTCSDCGPIDIDHLANDVPSNSVRSNNILDAPQGGVSSVCPALLSNIPKSIDCFDSESSASSICMPDKDTSVTLACNDNQSDSFIESPFSDHRTVNNSNQIKNNQNKKKKKNNRKKSNTLNVQSPCSGSSEANSKPIENINHNTNSCIKENLVISTKTEKALPNDKNTSVKPKADDVKAKSNSAKLNSEPNKSISIESPCPKATPKTTSEQSQASKSDKPTINSPKVPVEKISAKSERIDASQIVTVTTTLSETSTLNSSTLQPSTPAKECRASEVSKTSSQSKLSSSLVPDHTNQPVMDESSTIVDSKSKPNGGKPFGQNVNGVESLCKICDKHVYHMEQIKAVKAVFHKSCFRCKECNKQLSVDTYSSHEGFIYCKPHFKQLFQPKAVFDSDDSKQNNTKQEDILDNLNLDLSNIRNRFEKGPEDGESKKTSQKPISRSESIHKIMQKYQNRVAGDKDISSSSDEEDNGSVTSETKEESKEKVAFSGMSALKSQWETGSISANSKSDSHTVEDELVELRKKVKTSEPLKQVYERAIQEAKSSENLSSKNENILVNSSVKAVSIKEKFEKGKLESETEEDRIERLRKEREEELSLIAESETNAKEARNKFKQIEANMGKDKVQTSNGHIEDVSINANELQQRFKYFENYKDNSSNNAKENSKDETDSKGEDIPKVDTAKKMLNVFKALEASQMNGADTTGTPKSPKRITPPRETQKVYESEPSKEKDPDIVKSSYKSEDVIEVEPEKAKNLRAKFENWQAEIERENRKNNYDEEDEYVPHIDTTKNLRAMFESIKEEYKPLDKPRPRINRFVDNKTVQGETCYVCSNRLYPMEKMEFSGIKIHKNCFRCNKCHTPLRLDNFTVRAEKLFCIPHFKQMFMEKGNYDEGFGLEQHKDKWSQKSSVNGKNSTLDHNVALDELVEPSNVNTGDSDTADESIEDYEHHQVAKNNGHFSQVVEVDNRV